MLSLESCDSLLRDEICQASRGRPSRITVACPRAAKGTSRNFPSRITSFMNFIKRAATFPKQNIQWAVNKVYQSFDDRFYSLLLIVAKLISEITLTRSELHEKTSHSEEAYSRKIIKFLYCKDHIL